MTPADAPYPPELLPLLTNYRSYFAGWGVEGRSAGPVTLFRSGIANPALNAVTGSTLPVVEAVRIARERMAGVPWLWDVTPDSAPGTAEALEALGARAVGTVPVMAVAAADVRRPALPAGGAPEPVDSIDDVEAWTTAWAPAMGVDLGDLERLVRLHRDRVAATAELTQFGAVVDGRFRATAELHRTGETGGVYLAATEEAYRGRGLATALVLAAVERAVASGAQVLTLQASAMGEPIYRRIGFETVGTIRRYRLPDAA